MENGRCYFFSAPAKLVLSLSVALFVPLSFLHLFQMCKQCLDCTKFGLNLCEWDITTVLKMENTEETAVCSTLYNEYYWMKLFLIVLWRQKASACVFVGFFALLLLPNKTEAKKESIPKIHLTLLCVENGMFIGCDRLWLFCCIGLWSTGWVTAAHQQIKRSTIINV